MIYNYINELHKNTYRRLLKMNQDITRELLKSIHVEKGVSLSHIARKVNLSRNTVTLFKNGGRKLSKTSLYNLNNVLKEYI